MTDYRDEPRSPQHQRDLMITAIGLVVLVLLLAPVVALGMLEQAMGYGP